MLGEAAHDIRGTITAIISLNKFLRQKVENSDDAEIKQLVKFIDIKCEQGLSILENLLIIDEINSIHGSVKNSSHCSLTNIIHEQVGIHRIQAKIKEIDFVVNIPEVEILCQIDQTSHIRILDNLISNAIKFTHRRGEIRIVAEDKERKIVIKICDNGIGIHKKHQETIFDKFTKARQRGTENEESNGLGLYIVKKIANRNNGNVYIESERNVGTTVTVELNRDILPGMDNVYD